MLRKESNAWLRTLVIRRKVSSKVTRLILRHAGFRCFPEDRCTWITERCEGIATATRLCWRNENFLPSLTKIFFLTFIFAIRIH